MKSDLSLELRRKIIDTLKQGNPIQCLRVSPLAWNDFRSDKSIANTLNLNPLTILGIPVLIDQSLTDKDFRIE